MIQTNNPYTFYVPGKYDPNHFMPWVHPFTSVISGPTGSGKSVFVRRFVNNIRNMMTPIPDRILWGYGEYQTLYGSINGVDFQHGLPDLDTLDHRDKHLIILDDHMDETGQRVASLFKKKSHHRNISVMYIVHRICFIEENTIEPYISMPITWFYSHTKCIPGERNFSWKPLPELRPDLTATW